MTIELSFAEAKRLVEEAIAEKGEDYVYEKDLLDGQETCAYFNADDTPGCIVGHVLAKAGVVVEDLAAYGDAFDCDSPDGLNHFAGVEGLVTAGFLQADRKARDYLSWIQAGQDTGIPWGSAKATAESRLAEKYGDSTE